MRHIPIAEFKDKVSEIVSAVEAGEEIVITRHGKAAVRLVAVDDEAERVLRRRKLLADLSRVRAKMRARGVSITRDEIIAWKNEGRP